MVQKNFQRKTYVIENGTVRCRLCNTQAVLKKKQCLLMQVPKRLVHTNRYPRYAQSDWEGISKQLCGCKLLISRTRDTGLHVEIDTSSYFLDVDLCAMLMPFVLFEQGIAIEILVCGHKTLKQAFLATAVSQLMEIPEPSSIVAVPYLHLNSPKGDPLTIQALLQRYKSGVLRSLLSMALGGTRKEITLLEQDLVLAEQALSQFQERDSIQHYCSLETIWEIFGLEKMRYALSCVKRGRTHQLSQESRQMLSLVL